MKPSTASLFPSRPLSLSSLQRTPRAREFSSRMSAPTPQTTNFHLDEQGILSAKAFDLPVDRTQFDRATSIKPCSMLRPHMRIFYLSWMSAITGFFGWYAIPPLMPVIKTQLGLTDGQVLNSDIASTASTIFSRIASGPLLDRFGPRAVQSTVLWLGAIPIFCAAFVNSATSLLIVRFFIGLVGCVFVSSQYWTTITFARNVVGTANAVTGGLEVSGIGLAFLILPFVYKLITFSGHVSEALGWRITIALPAVLMITMGLVIRFAVDECPTGDFQELMDKKRKVNVKHQSLLDSFKVVLSDRNVIIMILQYSACFGTELQLNNMGALYFYTEFDKKNCDEGDFCSLLTKTNAATVASSFGLTNLFARAVGGLMSDAVNRRLGMRGRQYVQCVLLCCLAALVMGLSRSHSLGLCITFYVLVAIVAQATGGSTYGIVPYLNEHHTGTVNGLVGAGGNMGGALFGVIFRLTGAYSTGLSYMSIFIFCCALLTPLLRLSQLLHQDNIPGNVNDHSQHGQSTVNRSLKPFLEDELESETQHYRSGIRAAK